MITENCTNYLNNADRRVKIHKRKLEMLKFFRDTLERRISAVNASIETLQRQIERDQNASE